MSYTLAQILTLMSDCNASDQPQSCSEYLQIIHGKKDVPCDSYAFSLVKGADLHKNGQRIPVFHLRADGIPVGKKFKIASRNARGQTLVVFEGVYFGDGKILPKLGMITNFAPILCGGFERGEPSQLLLLDEEKKTTNAVFYLPYPVEPALRDELKLNMYCADCNPLTYLFDIEGLTPGETVQAGNIRFTAPDSGKAFAAMTWTKKELPKGEATFEVQRANGTLRMTFPWVPKLNNCPAPMIIFTIDRCPTAEEIKKAGEFY